MSWDRKEVANLLMVGAGIIAGIETAVFGKWVDALVEPGARVDVALMIARVGFWSTVGLAAAWLFCRIFMGLDIAGNKKLSWPVSLATLLVYVAIATGWVFAHRHSSDLQGVPYSTSLQRP